MDQKKLDEAAKSERRAYFKAWRAANRDKVQQHNRSYWEKRAAQRLQEQQDNGDQKGVFKCHE